MKTKTDKRLEQIEAAQAAIDAIKFVSWPNREIEKLAMGILEAAKFDHYSMAQNLELSSVMARIGALLAKGLEEEAEQRRSDASMRIYKFTQELTLARDVDDPEHFQDGAAHRFEAERLKSTA